MTLLHEQNRSRQILLIDPDEVFCQVLQDVLGTAYKLRRVSTAKAGASRLDSADVDVILLNLDLQNGPAANEDILTLVRLTSEQKFAPPMIVYGWDTRRNKAVEGSSPGRCRLPRTTARRAGFEVSVGGRVPARRPDP